MENARKKNATRGKERSYSPRRVTVAGSLLLVIGLVVLAGCATSGKAKQEESRADFEQVITMVMVMGVDYEKTIELTAEWQNPVTGAATALGGNAESAPVALPAQSKAPIPKAVPLETEISEQPAVVPSCSEGNEHGTSAKQ